MGKKKKKEVDEKPIEKPSKKQIEKENKILRNIFIVVAILFALFLLSYLISGSIKNFEYKGVSFEKVKKGGIKFYNTQIPVNYQGQVLPYNFYLRNDPRELEKVEFSGELNFFETGVINESGDFFCEGDSQIALLNLKNLYDLIGVKLVKDETAGCDPQDRYLFLRLLPGNVTKIEQISKSCYDLYINNCEILEVTEKLMVESFIKINKDLNF